MAGRFSVEAVFKAVDRVTAPVSRMQTRVGKFTRGMARGLRTVNRVLGKTTKLLKRGASAALKFGGFAVAAGITAVAVAMNKAADAADALAKQSRRLQFPIEELQEWKFIAEQSGIANELFSSSLGAFSKRLGEAEAGSGPLVTGLKKLNPVLLEQLIQTDSISDALGLYINAIRNADTATEKAALANAAFSRAGLQLVNIADNSATAIKALRMEQRENGNITLKQAEAAEAYNDAVNSLKRSLVGLVQNILLPMLPAITKTVRAWREWIVANNELIRGRILEFFDQMKTAVVDLLDRFRKFNEANDILGTLVKIVTFAGTAFAFLAEHGTTIATVIAGVVGLNAVLGILTGVLTAVNVVMAANPVGLLVLALVAAAAAIFLAWEPIKAFFVGLWESVVGVIDAISNIPSGISDFFNPDENATGSTRGGRPQIVSPQERVARSIDEQRTTSTAEVTIKDDTGRAEVTGGRMGPGLKLQSSGAF